METSRDVLLVEGNDDLHVIRHLLKKHDGIPADERRFSETKRLRAHVHAWLAARRSPRPMGQAIGAGDLLHDGPTATALVDWLRRLFDFD